MEGLNFIILIPVCVILISIWFIYDIIISSKEEKERKKFITGKFIYYKDFEKNWLVMKQGKKKIEGYKYHDGPGCYIILIHNKPVINNNYMKYESIYVGQSVNICQRVHNHFTGKGKGDVYADIKYGKHVYVRFVPCKKKEMNDLERELIDFFNATGSYNATKGGSKRRKNEK